MERRKIYEKLLMKLKEEGKLEILEKKTDYLFIPEANRCVVKVSLQVFLPKQKKNLKIEAIGEANIKRENSFRLAETRAFLRACENLFTCIPLNYDKIIQNLSNK